MKITKRIILIILSALLVLSVVACGKAEENPKGEENTPPVEQDPPAQEEPPSEDEEPSQGESKFQKYILPENIKTEVVEAWKADHDYYPNNFHYYGIYNGYVIIFAAGPADKSTSIGFEKDIVIHWGSDFEMYAYKNGVFNKIYETYKAGLLSREDVAAIAKYHEEHWNYIWDNL